jgi:sensor domain CHASE-containing protein
MSKKIKLILGVFAVAVVVLLIWRYNHAINLSERLQSENRALIEQRDARVKEERKANAIKTEIRSLSDDAFFVRRDRWLRSE